MQIHRHRARFLRGKDLLPWAFSIARNLLVDRTRRIQRAEQAVRSTDEAHRLSHVALPDEVVHARELMARLERTLAALPAPQRDAFALTRQHGLSPDAAAATLDITVGALRVRLHRARQALAATLRSDDEWRPGCRSPEVTP